MKILKSILGRFLIDVIVPTIPVILIVLIAQAINAQEKSAIIFFYTFLTISSVYCIAGIVKFFYFLFGLLVGEKTVVYLSFLILLAAIGGAIWLISLGINDKDLLFPFLLLASLLLGTGIYMTWPVWKRMKKGGIK